MVEAQANTGKYFNLFSKIGEYKYSILLVLIIVILCSVAVNKIIGGSNNTAATAITVNQTAIINCLLKQNPGLSACLVPWPNQKHYYCEGIANGVNILIEVSCMDYSTLQANKTFCGVASQGTYEELTCNPPTPKYQLNITPAKNESI